MSTFRPPNGCLQYHIGLSGQITTFNYNALNDNHLPNQRYNICIRRELGFCCVQYQACGAIPGSTDPLPAFSLATKDVNGNRVLGNVDDSCTLDYIAIPGKIPIWNLWKTVYSIKEVITILLAI